MGRIVIIIILLFHALCGYSQSDEEVKILGLMVIEEGFSCDDRTFVQCEKKKTWFSASKFKKESGLNVPNKILEELEVASIKSTDTEWNIDAINSLKTPLGEVNSSKCLTEQEVISLFDEEQERQNVIAISQPIFDSSFEHCVVGLTRWSYHRSRSGYTCLLKKVYGRWVVIDSFNFWMT